MDHFEIFTKEVVMDPVAIPVLGIVFSLFILPATVFGFILIIRKQKTDIQKLEIKKQMLELELQKEKVSLRLLEEENKKYDRLIESNNN
jgi:hypothetical protein